MKNSVQNYLITFNYKQTNYEEGTGNADFLPFRVQENTAKASSFPWFYNKLLFTSTAPHNHNYPFESFRRHQLKLNSGIKITRRWKLKCEILLSLQSNAKLSKFFSPFSPSQLSTKRSYYYCEFLLTYTTSPLPLKTSCTSEALTTLAKSGQLNQITVFK